MAGKCFFIDTSKCTACRGCQVACKQWNGLPGTATQNTGSFQNPPDLSFETYKLVRFKEHEIDGKLFWCFFPDQCRHCLEPPCFEEAENIQNVKGAVEKEETTGAVIYTEGTKKLKAEDLRMACPFDIPRVGKKKVISKCIMCMDRVVNGLQPACVKSCPTGAMNFGDYDVIIAQAGKRLEQVKAKNPKAQLLGLGLTRVIYLVLEEPSYYHEYAYVPKNDAELMDRKMALKKLFKPVASGLKSLA